uniref:RRM domain-containing protein n=1 Tax=Rhabditophanes sp. KR3021 TaxID=114890 RepID=A0AC35TNY6_9BILA
MTTIETPILKAPKEVNAGSNYKTFKDKPSLKLEDTGAVSFELRNNNEGSSGTIQKKCLSETDPTTEVSTGNSTGDGYQTDDSSDDDRNNDPRKMFIGGLSFLTTPEKLREYFSQFGEIAECMVMRDPQTKRARGFGFITFAETEGVDKVLELANHELDNKRIDPKVAFPKKIPQKLIVRTKKVFLGGVSSTSTIEDLRNYFDDFGIVKDAMLMYDKSTQRHRGFGFVTFDDEEVADRVCEIHFHEINAKMVECKKAQPKEIMFPILVNKTKAAMARHPLGMAPEQLLGKDYICH